MEKQQKLKRIVTIAVLALISVIVFSVAILMRSAPPVLSNTSTQVLALKRRVLSDKELGEEISRGMEDSGRKGFYVVFLSISDIKTRARVFRGAGTTLRAAWSDVDIQAAAFARSTNYAVRWAKADVVDSLEGGDASSLSRALAAKDVYYQNFLRKGVALGRDFNVAFLEAELNGNKMLMYARAGYLSLTQSSPRRAERDVRDSSEESMRNDRRRAFLSVSPMTRMISVRPG